MKTDTSAIKNISEGLKKSKDVVATFQISKSGVEDIEWLSKRYNISVKKLFDSFPLMPIAGYRRKHIYRIENA